jgi:hypothetical protein
MTSAEFALSLGVRVLNLETYTAVRIDPPGGGVFCIGQSLQGKRRFQATSLSAGMVG